MGRKSNSYKQIQQFIGFQAESMEHTIEYAKSGNLDTAYPTNGDKLDYVLKSLYSGRSMMLGAISYAHIFAGTLKDDEAREFIDHSVHLHTEMVKKAIHEFSAGR